MGYDIAASTPKRRCSFATATGTRTGGGTAISGDVCARPLIGAHVRRRAIVLAERKSSASALRTHKRAINQQVIVSMSATAWTRADAGRRWPGGGGCHPGDDLRSGADELTSVSQSVSTPCVG